MKIFIGLNPLSFSNSSLTRLIFYGRPGLQSQSISIMSPSSAGGSSPASAYTGAASYLMKRELG